MALTSEETGRTIPAVGIRLFGPLSVEGAGDGGGNGRYRAFSPRDRVVLAVLALHPGEVVTRDRLADAMWGEDPPASWPKVVQGCVVRVRKVLGPSAVETTPRGYRLALGDEEIDVCRFERQVERGRELATTGEPDRAASALEQALVLWQGPPFEDIVGWTAGRNEVARLEELRRSAEEDLLDARLQSGDHRGVATEGEALVAEEPLRERRWAILALAQYRCGRQADALRSLHRARTILAEEMGVDPGPELVGLEAGVLRQDPELAASPEPPAGLGPCPYKGLAPYDVGDSDSFFGREAEVAACVRRLEGCPLLVVTGPSGCGKSSLVRAGLIPALARRGREASVFVPGTDPLGAMANALASGPDTPVLVADQFEEAFTFDHASWHADEVGPGRTGEAPGGEAGPAVAGGTRAQVPDRAAGGTAAELCRRLAAYAREQGPVVVVLRADHLTALTADAEFARLAERGVHLVSPLTGDQLRAAIEGPATQAGARLEHGLVDLLVRDTEGEPGALPLMSHALAETWARRDGRVLTVDGYRATGGIRGAVARSADRLYESLPPDERATLRSVLLRLVAPSLDGDPVRSRVPTRTLGGDPARERVVGMLVRARLVTAHQETVELAHEALARAWPRLTNWLDEDVAGQRILRHLAGAAEGWDSLGRPASELYRGPRLDAALDWREAAHPDLTDVEADFLDASQAQLASEQEAMAERARHQARQNRRLRSSLVGVAVLLVVALVAGLLAFSSGNEARDQRDAAQAAQRDTQLEALVNRSLALRQSDRALAALLAVEAYRRQPDTRAWSALLGTFTETPGFAGYEHLPADGFLHGALVPGTTTAIVALDGGDLVAWDTRDGTVDRRFPPTDRDVGYAVVEVSEDGRIVAHTIVSGEGCEDLKTAVEETDGAGCWTTSAYEVATGRRIMGPILLPFGPDTAVNADGSLVAVAGGYTGKVVVYRTADGQVLGTFPGLARPAESVNIRDTAAVAFGPDGRLYLGSMAGPIRVVDPQSLEVVDTYDAPPFSSHNHLIVTGDGLLVGGGDHALVAVDTATGRQRWAVDIRTGTHPEQCPWMAVAPTVGRLYCGNYYGLMEERDLATGERTGVRFDPQLGSVGDLVVSADGRELLAFAVQAPIVSRWRLDGSGPLTRLVAEGYTAVDGYDPSGDALLVAKRDGVTPSRDVAVWDPVADEMVEPLGADVTGGLWITSDIIGVALRDGRIGTIDRRRDGPVWFPPALEPGGAHGAWTSADGSRTYVAYDPPSSAEMRTEILTYGEGGKRVEPTIEANGHVTSVSTTADGSRLVLTTDYGLMTVHDARTGERVRGPVENAVLSSVGPGDVLVAANGTGDLIQYDLDALRPVGAFPGARGGIESLQFSDDGRVLAASSSDLTVSLYDVATRSRLGDPLPTAATAGPQGVVQGWLHPDGTTVATNTRLGITLWDVDPKHLAEAACRMAGRNLTRAEWATYLADLGGYRATCPDQPPPPGT